MKIMDIKEHLDKMEQLAATHVRDVNVRKILMDIIEKDKLEGNFNWEKYLEFYDDMGRLGKVQMDIWKVDKVLMEFYKSLAVVRAAVKFKRGIKKP